MKHGHKKLKLRGANLGMHHKGKRGRKRGHKRGKKH